MYKNKQLFEVYDAKDDEILEAAELFIGQDGELYVDSLGEREYSSTYS